MFLKAGKNVLVEKPMAASLEDISVAALRYGKSDRTTPGALAQITASVIHQRRGRAAHD